MCTGRSRRVWEVPAYININQLNNEMKRSKFVLLGLSHLFFS